MSIPTPDERHGAPSASGMERIVLCPGSWNLERELRGVEDSTPDSRAGERIHQWLHVTEYARLRALDMIGPWDGSGRSTAPLSIGEIPDLSGDEMEMARACRKLADSVLLSVFPPDSAPYSHAWLEERLYYRDEKSGRVLCSGKPDAVYWGEGGSRGLIIDYKTGRSETSKASSNIQLETLVALIVLQNEEEMLRDIDKLYAVIVQPYAYGLPEVAEYGKDDMRNAVRLLKERLEQVARPDAPRIPGAAQCRYCRAARRLVCKEFIEAGLQGAEQLPNDPPTCPPDRLVALWQETLPLARRLAECIEEETFRRLCADPACLPGLDLELGKPRVSDAQKLWTRKWMETNNLITDSGRAKKGANDAAKAAWQVATSELIRVDQREVQVWVDRDDAIAALAGVLSEEELRMVAGRVVSKKEEC